ncbi:MAG TPA: AAC(3) family N-acetyltransferase [Erysipelotrichaceae bacterium]|nr:AAC(3) family N-acetyltransferase [Erysipelotrichaceae bacterium]
MLALSKNDLLLKLESLNIFKGDIILLHSQLTNSDLDISQRRAFLSLLINYLGEQGTIIMDYSGSNFDVSEREDVYKLSDYADLRSLMPAFDQTTAHLYADDLLAITLASYNNCLMSDSYAYPYIGVGKYAKLILSAQSLNFPNGNLSPLAKLYQLRAKILVVNSHLNDLALNAYTFETSQASLIKVNGGMQNKDNQAIWSKFLEKEVDKEMVSKTLKSSEIKKLFYYSDLKGLNLLSSDVRSYVDYFRAYLEERD